MEVGASHQGEEGIAVTHSGRDAMVMFGAEESELLPQ